MFIDRLYLFRLFPVIFVTFLLSYWVIYLYTLATSPLLGICFASIIYKCVACLFFIVVSFDEQKLFDFV